VKEYLENAKNPDAVPFSSTMQVEWDCSLMSLFQFFDEHGKYRAQIASMVGPEATVPKQVERFHAEMLEHIEAVDSVSLRTPERELVVNLGSVRLSDLYSQASEDVPAVTVDLHPTQELIGALGIGIVGGAVAISDKILYRNDISVETTVENTKPNDARFGLDYEDVTLETEDGVTLKCWLVKCSPSAWTMLYFHGNAGDMASRLGHVKCLQESIQCNILMVSYRGYGQSSGKPSEEGFMMDALAAYKFLVDRNITDIIVYGHSIGGAVAIHLVEQAQAQGVKPAALIVENTFTSIAEMAGPLLRRVGEWLPSKWKSNEKITSIQCPILLLSGRCDTIVPPEMMDLLKFNATSSAEVKLVEFPLCGHNDTINAEDYYMAICNFITMLLQK